MNNDGENIQVVIAVFKSLRFSRCCNCPSNFQTPSKKQHPVGGKGKGGKWMEMESTAAGEDEGALNSGK